MPSTRPPAVAGLFYPADRRELDSMIQGLLAEKPSEGCQPKAIIAPHAGYVYSGPVAASAYRRLGRGRSRIRRVVVIGPSHRVAFDGVAIPNSDAFSTPLGTVPIDRAAIAGLIDLPFVQAFDEAHVREHSLEVQLPFLQAVLDGFMLVPIVVGDALPEQVAEVLDRLWDGDETAIVISSDLSHYHDYRTAQRMDQETSRAIEALNPDEIGYDNACGRLAVGGLLLAVKQRGLKIQTIDLRNSGDTFGPKDRVVGYGAYVTECA